MSRSPSLPASLRVPALLLAAGCAAVGPDYRAPAPAVAAAWHQELSTGLSAAAPDVAAWWRLLDDPLLTDLIERAGSQGLDLRQALARVREARALRGGAAADRFPSLDADLGYQRRGDSKNTPLGAFATEYDSYAIGVDATWELDLWGRVRRSVEAADADLAATIEDARGAAVMVAAETARHYVQLRAQQRRLAIARTNVALQEGTLALVRARFQAGLVRERDVAQAATNLEATRARLPALETDLRAAQNRLAVLLGCAPGALASELDPPGAIPVPPAEVAVGVPADVLRRRPDVRRAERELAAATARIGVAEGDLYPRLTLFGSIGLDADHVSNVFESSSRLFQVGPSLRWNLFDGGRLRSRVRAQDARAEQALVRFERAVLVALEESENALTAFVREQERRSTLAAATAQARRAVDLAQAQYGEGLSDFQPVLDSQRALADLEDQVAASEAAVTGNLILLYKALGGGWEGRLAAAVSRRTS